MNDEEFTAQVQRAFEVGKEIGYKEGWVEGFEYCMSLMQRPIRVPDNEVKDEITPVDAFLQNLKW